MDSILNLITPFMTYKERVRLYTVSRKTREKLVRIHNTTVKYEKKYLAEVPVHIRSLMILLSKTDYE